jgi:hypothetical protein
MDGLEGTKVSEGEKTRAVDVRIFDFTDRPDYAEVIRGGR